MATNAQAVFDPMGRSNEMPPARREEFHAELEKALIVTYLRSRGYSLRSVCELPAPQGKELLKAANTYAALRMTEIEARMRYLDAINGRS
jgi:hypothetical protein